MKLFPKKYKYSVIYEDVEYPAENDPNGWADEAVAYSRGDDYGVNTELSGTAKFCFSDKTLLKRIFNLGGFNSSALLKIKKRLNILTYQDFYTSKIDFKKTTFDGNFFEVDASENSIYAKLTSKKTQNYTVPMPTDGKIYLYYDGCRTKARNIITCDNMLGEHSKVDDSFSNNYFGYAHYLNWTWSTKKYTANIGFAGDDALLAAHNSDNTAKLYSAYFIQNTIASLTISGSIHLIGYHHYSGNDNPTPPSGFALRITNGIDSTKLTYLGIDESGMKKYIYENIVIYAIDDYDVSEEALINVDCVVSIVSPDGSYGYNIYIGYGGKEWKANIPVKAGGYMRIAAMYSSDRDWVQDDRPQELNVLFEDLTFSKKYGTGIQVVTHKWWINALMTKILGNTDFTLKIDDDLFEHYTPLLTTTDELNSLSSRYMYGTLKDALDSLDTLFMTTVWCYGKTLWIRKRANSYPTNNIRTINTCTKPSFKVDDKHIYNIVKTGWNKGDFDDTNGTYEALATNEFGMDIDMDDDNTLEIIHPYYGSALAIENYLKTKADDGTDTDNSKDKKIFIFACNNSVNSSGYYTLCRDYKQLPTGQFDITTYYNLCMSPMRILKTHRPYLDVSRWKNNKEITFTKAERDAVVTSQMSWENEVIHEDWNIPSTEVANPIFLPLIYEFTSDINFDSLDEISGENAYPMICIKNSYIGDFNGWIEKVSFKIGKEEKQKFQLRGATFDDTK